jgi:3-methyladenine DNA glycosylase AlkD
MPEYQTPSKTIIDELVALRRPETAIFEQRFFRTGPGEYGEGDLFLGLKVPTVRAIAKKHKQIAIKELDVLLQNKLHEVRLCALVIMTLQMPKASITKQQQLYKLYLRHAGKGINNWDLVDISCAHIVGRYLYDKDRMQLYELAQTSTGNWREILWKKRIAIISTFYFLRNDNPVDTYQIAELLVHEQHDLLQKAVGWSIREMGKRDGELLRQFLNTYAATMPRTALRYALEKLPQQEKAHYMSLKGAAQ